MDCLRLMETKFTCWPLIYQISMNFFFWWRVVLFHSLRNVFINSLYHCFFHSIYSSEVNVMVYIVITFLIFQSFKPCACKEGNVQLWDNSQYRSIWIWLRTYIPRWHQVLEYVCPVLVGSECVQAVTKKSIQVWFAYCPGFCVYFFPMLYLKMYTSFRKT